MKHNKKQEKHDASRKNSGACLPVQLGEAATLSPGLYVVATPIGNLEDVTKRALSVLGGADRIACEDTRITRRLLDRHAVSTASLWSYHEHNAIRQRPKILDELRCQRSVALVCDAGTPLISDPGYKLVRACHMEHIPVFGVPGPSALTNALSICGLPTDRVLFLGFLPATSGARRRCLQEVSTVRASLVLYERSTRLAACLQDIAAILGERPVALCREMTKRFEEIHQDSASALASTLSATPVKGEAVLVIGYAPPTLAQRRDACQKALVRDLAPVPFKEAVRDNAQRFGLAQRDVYTIALKLRESDR